MPRADADERQARRARAAARVRRRQGDARRDGRARRRGGARPPRARAATRRSTLTSRDALARGTGGNARRAATRSTTRSTRAGLRCVAATVFDENGAAVGGGLARRPDHAHHRNARTGTRDARARNRGGDDGGAGRHARILTSIRPLPACVRACRATRLRHGMMAHRACPDAYAMISLALARSQPAAGARRLRIDTRPARAPRRLTCRPMQHRPTFRWPPMNSSAACGSGSARSLPGGKGVTAAGPERYTLAFQPGGRVLLRADCNRGKRLLRSERQRDEDGTRCDDQDRLPAGFAGQRVPAPTRRR